MNNPKAKDILKVIRNLKKVLPMATHERHLNMDTWMVNQWDYKCGSIHCHAGWYAIATCDTKEELDYDDGITKMVKHLGFANEIELLNWAKHNPYIWGNGSGWGMFADHDAFFHEKKRPEGAKTLQDIIDHWKDVYKRLKALEKTA